MLVLRAGSRQWWIERLLFSTDGAVLAAPASSIGVYLLPTLGGSPRLVQLPPHRSAKRAVFSPDGSRLYLYVGCSQLAVIHVPTGAFELLAFPRWSDCYGVSLDGSRLIVGSFRSEGPPKVG